MSSFAKLFFAIAVLFLGQGKFTKITVTMDSKPVEVFTLADGKWSCDEGVLTYDKEKQSIGFIGADSPKTDKPEMTAITDLLTASAEKPEPKTVTFNGTEMSVVRKGNDVTLTATKPSDLGPKEIVIHFE